MPAFDDEVLAATAAVDAVFAEAFTLRPYAKPNLNGPEQPDPARDTVQLVGVWRTKAADPREPDSYDKREWRRPGVESATPHVEFSASALACLSGLEIRAGDHVERLSTGVAYLARTPTFSPNGTMTVPLNYLGKLP